MTEERILSIEKLTEEIVEGMPLVELKNIVWDKIFNELLELDEDDLELFAEDYQVEL